MNKHIINLNKIILGIGLLVLLFQVFYFFNIPSYDQISKRIVEKDMVAFLTGATIISRGNSNLLYNREHQKEVQMEIVDEPLYEIFLGYISPPIVAGLFLPAVDLELDILFRIYFNILLASVNISLILSMSLYKFDIKAILVPAIFFTYLPMYTSLQDGQLTPVLLVILIFIYYAIKHDRNLLAGLLSSLFMIKAHFLILPVYLFFLLNKNKAFLKGVISGTSLLVVISLLLAPTFITEYPKMLIRVTNVETSLSIGTRIQNNINLYNYYPFLGDLIGSNFASFVIVTIITIILNIAAIYFILKLKNFEIAFSLSVLAMLIFNVHTLSYDFLIFLFPIVLFVKGFIEKKILLVEMLLVVLIMVSLFIVPLAQQALALFIMLVGFIFLLGISLNRKKMSSIQF
jgi:hypothetical protein